MRSTFWPNRSCERQISQNRHTFFKFSSKRENSALSSKLYKTLISGYAQTFRQIAFWSVKVFKIVMRALNSAQNGKTVRFLWKLYKTLFSGHAEHVLPKSHFGAAKFSKSWNWPQILFKTEKQFAFHENCTKTLFSGHAGHVLPKSHLRASKFSKSSHWPQILSKKGKQCALHENCTKRSFQVMRSFFSPNRNLERQSSQNRHTGFKFSSKRENSALSIKSVQNTHFRSCAARFGQIAFWIVKVFKIVMASNSLQHRKTVRFP